MLSYGIIRKPFKIPIGTARRLHGMGSSSFVLRLLVVKRAPVQVDKSSILLSLFPQHYMPGFSYKNFIVGNY
jgi:hypothetical protein